MSDSMADSQPFAKPQILGKPNYEKAVILSLKNDPRFNEHWLQEHIAEDPTLLGLGALVLKDRERMQPNAGRLDLLLQEENSVQRYEVEIQLGKSDESHIIRTIEYWDIERKRYPQYEHTAVLIAEDITSRFLNVVSLFNGFIPLIAIQLSAIEVNDAITLIFTKVLDQMTLGFEEEEEAESDGWTREIWEKKARPETMKLADQCLRIIHEFSQGVEFKYTKFYIGLTRDGKVNNFAQLVPQKKFINLRIRIEPSEQINSTLDEAGIDYEVLSNSRANQGYRYRIRLTSEDEIAKNHDILKDLLAKAENA